MGSSGKSGTSLTTKGDLQGFSTGNARIPVGTDGQVLTARSSATQGVDWEAATAGVLANEAQASILTNATSAGDAGARADHFTGAALAAKWTVRGVAATTAVATSTFNITRTSGVAAQSSWISQAYTPTGALRIEARCRLDNGAGATTANCSIFLTDDPVNLTHFAQVLLNVPAANQLQFKFQLDTGAQGNGPTLTDMGQWVYIRLDRDGANHWTPWYSFDRAQWDPAGNAGVLDTFTVVAIAFEVSGGGTLGGASIDFIDVVT